MRFNVGSMAARFAMPLCGLGASVLSFFAADSAFAKGPPTPLDQPPTLYTFKLDDAGPQLSLLRSYLDASVERPGPYNRYVGGAYGRWAKDPWLALAWGNETATPKGENEPSAEGGRAEMALVSVLGAEGTTSVPMPSGDDARQTFPRIAIGQDLGQAFGFGTQSEGGLRVQIAPNDWVTRLFVANDAPFWTTGPSLAGNGFDALWAGPAKPVVDWRCRRRPVMFVRFAGQSDRFSLVQCGGAVEPGAVDRLSIIARPPDAPDPGELPLEPDPEAWEKGEWAPQVKLVHPRLVWLLQKIADAFPHRAIYIYSGYRPHKEKSGGQGHHSLHGDGRAMDIQVYGVRNEALFAYCRKLEDVGCGFYPNSKFVHVDVRKPATGHAFWVDASGPGEPPHYVDSWPGVVDHGALAWMRVPEKVAAPPQHQRPRTPDERGTADVIAK